MKSTLLKQMLRSVLGDEITGWIHAVRMARLAKAAFGTLGEEKEPDMALIPVFVKKGEVVVDIGANGADWTLGLSRQVGDKGSVFAFEADPYYAQVTRKTIAVLRLKNVEFFPFGLSDRSEVTMLQVRNALGERVSGMGTIVRNIESQKVDEKKFEAVRLQPLDSIARSYPALYNVRLIKCDVEGFELMVFRGAMDVLKKARPIVITEVGGAHLHGYSDAELFDFFKGLNYTSYVVVVAGRLRRCERAGDIPEGIRPNRVMIPNEAVVDPKIIFDAEVTDDADGVA